MWVGVPSSRSSLAIRYQKLLRICQVIAIFPMRPVREQQGRAEQFAFLVLVKGKRTEWGCPGRVGLEAGVLASHSACLSVDE